jgi:hypothetical protein
MINMENGYNYEGFYETTGENSADIYFAEETKIFMCLYATDYAKLT